MCIANDMGSGGEPAQSLRLHGRLCPTVRRPSGFLAPAFASYKKPPLQTVYPDRMVTCYLPSCAEQPPCRWVYSGRMVPRYLRFVRFGGAIVCCQFCFPCVSACAGWLGKRRFPALHLGTLCLPGDGDFLRGNPRNPPSTSRRIIPACRSRLTAGEYPLPASRKKQSDRIIRMPV